MILRTSDIGHSLCLQKDCARASAPAGRISRLYIGHLQRNMLHLSARPEPFQTFGTSMSHSPDSHSSDRCHGPELHEPAFETVIVLEIYRCWSNQRSTIAARGARFNDPPLGISSHQKPNTVFIRIWPLCHLLIDHRNISLDPPTPRLSRFWLRSTTIGKGTHGFGAVHLYLVRNLMVLV